MAKPQGKKLPDVLRAWPCTSRSQQRAFSRRNSSEEGEEAFNAAGLVSGQNPSYQRLLRRPSGELGPAAVVSGTTRHPSEGISKMSGQGSKQMQPI